MSNLGASRLSADRGPAEALKEDSGDLVLIVAPSVASRSFGSISRLLTSKLAGVGRVTSGMAADIVLSFCTKARISILGGGGGGG